MKEKIFSKLLAVTLAFVMVFTGVGVGQWEPEQAWAETVIEVSSAGKLPNVIEEGTIVKLSADITLEEGQQISSLAGVLDGQGHTITLADKPLADIVCGTIQNLCVASSVTINGNTTFGSIAITLEGGTIQNCGSTADIYISGFTDIGGLVGTMKGGVIRNSYYGGGSSAMFASGLVGVNNSADSQLSDCYYTIGYSAVGKNNPKPQTSNCSSKTVSELKSGAINKLLNNNLPDIGYYWSSPEETGMPILKEGKPPVAKEELTEKIVSAKAVINDNYTEESWQNLQNVITEAEQLAAVEEVTQDQVDEMVSKLSGAISGLQKKKPTEPVAMPDDESQITHIQSIDDLKTISSGYYILDNDITISNNYYTSISFQGVLDGQGHTITFENAWSGIFSEVGSEGIVQNLYLTGTIDSWQSTGTIASGSLKGTVINCFTDVSGQYACGFAGLLNGGVLINCYSVSTGEKGSLFGQYYGGSLTNTYWKDDLVNSAINNITEDNKTHSFAKTEADMKSKDFVNLLNENRGTYGIQWGQNGTTGYPYFGADQNYTPGEEAIPADKEGITVKFTNYSGNVVTIENQKFDISTEDVGDSNIVGSFSIEGLQNGSTIEWGYYQEDKNGKILIGADQGNLRVDGDGSAVIQASEHKPDGSVETIAYIKITSTSKIITDMKLVFGGNDVTNGECTVQGSEWASVKVLVKYKEEETWNDAASNRFTYSADDTNLVYNTESSSYFYFHRPGTATITVSSRQNPEVKAYVKVTSEYVKATEIQQTISDTITIHGINANSYDRDAFNPIYASVQVIPENASYREQISITSSNPEVAAYVPSMVVGYVPYKGGKTRFTATLSDKDPVTGEVYTLTDDKEVTFVYLNPLKNVIVKNTAITVKNNQSISAGLVFEGTLTDGHEVTETGMNWLFSQDGIVEITRENGAWKRDESAPDNNMYFLSSEYTIRGLQEGTVTVTGTPADQTGGANQVTFEVIVTAGDAETPADNNKLITEGLNDAKNYYKAQNAEDLCVFGNEWYFFTLTRSGVSIDPENVEKYLNSVKTAYTTGLETDKANKLKPTTLARVILAVSSLGEDPENLNGANLIEMLYSSARIVDGGNEAIWALLALDCCNYSIPADAVWTRDKLINEILDYQSADGGFAWSGKGQNPDIDTTAMAIQVLAPYYGKSESVGQAIDSALDYLKSKMNSNCQFGSSETSSQVLIALAALGKDPVSEENGFVKSVARNLISGLDSYRITGKGFKHLLTDSSVNAMATDQALRGLEACRRFYNSENSLYDLTDVNVRKTLEKRVAEANALQEEYYKADLWAAMIDARDKAEAVLANGNASPEELKSADTALSSALAALYQSNPTPGVKAEDIVTYVTIAEEGKLAEGKDSTVMGDVPVTVEDRNSDGKHDVGEVLYAVHERYYEGGAANGFDYMDTWMTKLWGKAASASGIFINDIFGSSGLADYVGDGDYVSVFTYSDKTGYSDKYIAFDKNVYSVRNGETVTINLKGTGYDQSWNVKTEPLSNVKVSILGGNRILGTTDESGNLAISSLEEGTYKLMAYSDDIVTVPAVATIIVKNPSAPQDQVFLRVADPSGRTYLTKTSYDFMAGETAYSILDKSGLEYKSRYYGIYGGYYVYEIEGLAEFDKGSGSGWMYRVNGNYPEISCSEFKLQAGDYVEWLYTTNLGSDIGAAVPEESKEVTTTGTSGSAATTAPTEVTVSGSTATATVKSENAAEAIKQAKENKSAEIVLNVAASDTKGAETVKVQLDTATVKSVVSDTDASLTVKTENGQVSLDREALTTVASEAKGATITLEVVTVSKPTETQQKAAGTNGQVLQLTVKSGDKIISDFNKGKATVTVEISDGLKNKKVAAIHIAEDGKIEQLSGKTVKIDGKDYYIFETPHFSAFALVDADELGLEANDEEANIEKVKKLVSDMSLKASSSKTSKKNIKVTLTVDKNTAAAVKEIEDMGYTVKYKYYRSTRKASKYQAKITKTTRSFTNTAGKKGTKYYYKARIQVYDKDGKLVAQTALKQCKYAARTWTK